MGNDPNEAVTKAIWAAERGEGTWEEVAKAEAALAAQTGVKERNIALRGVEHAKEKAAEVQHGDI